MKEKSAKLGKKEFLKLCASLYDDAKTENAGILNLYCMINENKQGTILEYDNLPQGKDFYSEVVTKFN